MVRLGCWSCRAYVVDSDGAPALFECPRCRRDNLFWSRVMVDCPSCRRSASIDMLTQEEVACTRCQTAVRPTQFGVHTIDPITPFTACDGPLGEQGAFQCRQEGWYVSYWPRADGPYDDLGALHERADEILSRVARSKAENVLAILPCAFRAMPALVGWSNVLFNPRDSSTAKFMGAGGSPKFQTDFEGILGVLRISVIAIATRAVAALLAQHPFYARFKSMFTVAEPRSSQLPVAEVPVVLQGVKRHATGVVWNTQNGEKWRVTRVNSDDTAELAQLRPDGSPSGVVLSAVSEFDLLRAGLIQM